MTIYEPKGRAREYSQLALNYFKGCDNGCKYCYVPSMMKQFRPDYLHSEVKSDVNYDVIEKSAKKFYGCNKQILLSFTGDPYCNAENGETAKVLEILNRHNHKVAILTKNPEKAKKDIEIFKTFGDRFKIGSTLTFDNLHDSKDWESGAETPEQRIEALRFFAENRINTWASFEPVIIPEQSLNVLKQIAGFIDHVKIGKLNNYNGLDKNIDWTKFLDDAVKICRQYKTKFYIKHDLNAFNRGTMLSLAETNADHLSL